MAIIGPAPWVNQIVKNFNFLTFQSSCFCSLDRRFFVREYRKRHFPGLYCLKKKTWKNGQFWSKTMGNVLCDILERKNAFLAYKNKKLKKSKN